jgi:hypothetical protein
MHFNYYRKNRPSEMKLGWNLWNFISRRDFKIIKYHFTILLIGNLRTFKLKGLNQILNEKLISKHGRGSEWFSCWLCLSKIYLQKIISTIFCIVVFHEKELKNSKQWVKFPGWISFWEAVLERKWTMRMETEKGGGVFQSWVDS